MIEYGHEAPILTADKNFGKSRRRAAAKLRRRERKTNLIPESIAIAKSRVDELAPIANDHAHSSSRDESTPIADASAASGRESDRSKPDKSIIICFLHLLLKLIGAMSQCRRCATR